MNERLCAQERCTSKDGEVICNPAFDPTDGRYILGNTLEFFMIISVLIYLKIELKLLLLCQEQGAQDCLLRLLSNLTTLKKTIRFVAVEDNGNKNGITLMVETFSSMRDSLNIKRSLKLKPLEKDIYFSKKMY